jgi:uncharacterized protein (TIGR03435 family)
MIAFDLRAYQISGPDWLDSDSGRFVIEATIHPGATKGQVAQMLQNLLADRFKFTAHRETRNVPLYELLLIKKGPTLKDPLAETPDAGEQQITKTEKDGFMRPPAGASGDVEIPGKGSLRMIVGSETITELAATLSLYSNRPVVDKSGLTGKYDYNLEFAPDLGFRNQQGGASDPAPDVIAAVRDQLGLKMDPKIGPIEMLVIDHAERIPTEN